MNTPAMLEHLSALVACDTQNPPRRIDGDSDIFRYCSDAVGAGFDVRVWDHGDGHVSWYAVRGRPDVLFNVHLDTVPVGEGWTCNPHQLRVADGKAYGRGACDIKGAAAVLLLLAQQGAQDLALLFTSDEEGAGGCCVSNFVAAGEAAAYRQIIVAEPTSCRAVLGHRGFLAVKTWFSVFRGILPKPGRWRTTPTTAWPAGPHARWRWLRAGARARTIRAVVSTSVLPRAAPRAM